MMDFNNWKNKRDILDAEKELQTVDPSLRVSSISGSTVAVQVGVMFPMKGNAGTIKRLRELGWIKGYGSMEGGKRYIRMLKPLKKYKSEELKKGSSFFLFSPLNLGAYCD